MIRGQDQEFEQLLLKLRGQDQNKTQDAASRERADPGLRLRKPS